MRILEKDKVAVEKGDMVCLYTGFADLLLEMKKAPDPKLVNGTCSGLQGRDEKLLQWISDSGLACLLADNYAVELIATGLTDPLPRKQPWLPLHEHCLGDAAAIGVGGDIAPEFLLDLGARHGGDLPAALRQLLRGRLAHTRPAAGNDRDFHTVAIALDGEPTAPGSRSGGAVRRKRLRLCSRNQRASSVR